MAFGCWGVRVNVEALETCTELRLRAHPKALNPKVLSLGQVEVSATLQTKQSR